MNSEYILLHQERKTQSHFCKYKYYFLLLPSAAATFLLLIINIDFDINFQTHDMHFSWNRLNDYKYIDADEKEFFIKTQGCTIPAFEPFDQSVVKFFYREDPINCYNDTNPPLVESDDTSIWIVEKYFKNYSIDNNGELKCYYRPFYRQPSSEDSSDDRFKYLSESILFYYRTDIKYEFIQVECHYKKQIIYRDFHSFVIKDTKNRITVEKSNKYSVLLIGIDAVSRLNFHRTMPKTLKYLEDLDAIEFKGFNKVGDNTFPNLLPILAGLSEGEITNSCYSTKTTFDNCTFIWNKYHEAGYYTAFAEDAPDIGLFNYVRDGFSQTPTDYYWRTFISLTNNRIGHEKHLNSNLCLGARLSVDVLLSYIKKFVTAMSTSPYFGFFWETSITHDYLNYPLFCDDKYAALLKSMVEGGNLENTVLIMLSDHGIRWGGIRSTHQGHIEERLPFLFVVLPKSFKKKYPLATYNMKKNTRRLTTPFDLHETILSLLKTESLTNKSIQKIIVKNNLTESRGISLFLPINETRTCQSADIEPHWCTCHRTRKMPLNETLPFKVASVVLKHLNNLLKDYTQCAKLRLNKVIDLTIGEPSYAIKFNHIVLDYTIILETHPGNGLFEATVRNTQNNWKVTATVSRINLYGTQSSCLDDFHLKLYCFCDDNIPQ